MSNILSTCENPDSCIHCVVLDVKHSKGSITKTYMQEDQLPKVVVYDDSGQGLDVKVDVASKGCVTGNPKCPSGKLYSLQTEKSYDVSVGANNFHLTTYDFFEKNSSVITFLIFLDSCILGDIPSILSTTYTLSVSECRNSPVGLFYDLFNQPKAIVATQNDIVILPKYEWEAGLTLNFEKKRKRSSGCTVEISGINSLTVGNKNREYKRRIAQKDINLNGQASKFIKKINSFKALKNRLAKMGATSEFPIVDLSFFPPIVTFTGKGSLQFSKKNVPYLKRELSLNLKNILNFELKVDLLQAVAARYKLDKLVAKVRAEEKAIEEKVKKEGGNGAYVGTEFDLFFTVEVSVLCTLISTADEPWEISLTPSDSKTKHGPSGSIEGDISIGARVALRGGAKFSVMNGYFEGEIHTEAKGTVATTGCFSISPHKLGGLELILFHKGIWAEVSMMVDASVDWDEDTENVGHKDRKAAKKGEQEFKEYTVTKKERWQIYDPCPKESSQCRVHFLPNPTPRTVDVEYWSNPALMQAL